MKHFLHGLRLSLFSRLGLNQCIITVSFVFVARSRAMPQGIRPKLSAYKDEHPFNFPVIGEMFPLT